MLTHTPWNFALTSAVTVFCKAIFTFLRWKVSHPVVKPPLYQKKEEKTVEGGKIQMGGKLRLLKPLWCSVGSGWGRFLFFHLARTNPCSFFFGLKWALKQVKQCSLRQDSASSKDTCRETARNTSFWLFLLCSYTLPCEYLHHRPTSSCCVLNFSCTFLWTSVVTICKDPSAQHWTLSLFCE